MFKITSYGFLCFCLFSTMTYAVDIPEMDMQADKYDSNECIDNNTQTCMNDQCLTSDSADCPNQCATLAKAKCQQESDD